MAIVKFNNDWLPSVSNWFDDFLGREYNFPEVSYSTPRVNIKEEGDNYHIEVAAPGMKKEDFNLSLENNVLTVSTERKDEKERKDENYTRREFNYHYFKRSFTLPEQVEADKIEAKYQDGILRIMLPKKEEAKQKPAKNIKIL